MLSSGASKCVTYPGIQKVFVKWTTYITAISYNGGEDIQPPTPRVSTYVVSHGKHRLTVMVRKTNKHHLNGEIQITKLIIQTSNNRMQLSNLTLWSLYFLYFKHANELPIEVDSGSLYTRNASFKPLLIIWTCCNILTAKLQEKTRKKMTSKDRVVSSDTCVLYVPCTRHASTHSWISIKITICEHSEKCKHAYKMKYSHLHNMAMYTVSKYTHVLWKPNI